MNEEKKLKRLLAPDGALDLVKKALNTVPLRLNEENVFDCLLEVVNVVTAFQYNHHKKMEEIKTFYDDSEHFVLIAPLVSTIKKCGMDIYKSKKHQTFVYNHCYFKKDRLGLKRRDKTIIVSNKNIFLFTDYYTGPQRLSFIQAQVFQSTSLVNSKMVEELTPKTYNFVKEAASTIIQKIEALQKVV